jgi:glutamyl-tRNA reductase
MNLQVLGCSYRNSQIAQRERLAFSPDQCESALVQLRKRFPKSEAVLLSTCNRVEIYTAAENPDEFPSQAAVAEFVAEFHQLPVANVLDQLLQQSGEMAVRHLFTVAASLDSMVLGEPQILSQVKQAYELATRQECVGPVTHGAFQAAVRAARRVMAETTIHQKRVSIPSVAVADFAKQIFERFDDKQVLVIGAGEMGDETLRYLVDEGARQVTVVNRNFERAQAVAKTWQGQAIPWERLGEALTAADLVVSTTGAAQPVVSLAEFLKIEPARAQRPLFVLDLALPRDFDPAIGERLGVYLYTIDDLQTVCAANRKARDEELPGALGIIQQETDRFMADLHHRTTAPFVKRLREQWQEPKEEELRRLLKKLPELDDRSRSEITQAFDRLVNKLLHPPLESLRSEANQGGLHHLLDAFKRLFQLRD